MTFESILVDHEDTYQDLCRDIFGLGLFDDTPQGLGAEMARLLVKLYDKYHGYVQSNGDTATTEALLMFAFDVSGPVFGSEVLRILNRLARPMAAYHAMVRAATSLPALGVVEMHYDMPSLALYRLAGKTMDLGGVLRTAQLPSDLGVPYGSYSAVPYRSVPLLDTRAWPRSRPSRPCPPYSDKCQNGNLSCGRYLHLKLARNDSCEGLGDRSEMPDCGNTDPCSCIV